MRLLDLSRSMDGKFRILLESEELPEIPEGDLDVTFKVHRKHRSLDANAYYWAMVNKMAAKLESSNEEVHRRQLERYGAFEMGEDGAARWVVVPDDGNIGLYLLDTGHVVKMSTKTGKPLLGHVCIVIKGSHEYNTKEMATLINGTLSDCHDLGIQTIDEIQKTRMLEEWGRKYEKKHKKKHNPAQ